ncbi:MFS transporter, partial [Actinocrinis sp.]|uniref:MFS transporter n=1 Tax=Actinocrinis sp. TaxID=1920516 RepID=UPI002D6EDFDF
SGASLQMVVGGYVVAYAMLLITGARLGDLFGRRRMFQTGVIVFTLASLGCGFAPDTALLIAFRFIQGGGAAVMVPQIISVIQTLFTGEARTKALSTYGVVLCSGAVVGMVVGGVLVSANLFGSSWRPVFLVNVPIGVLLALAVPRYVPADTPVASRKLDVVGLITATASVFLIVLPLILGHEESWPAWTFVSIVVGVLLAALFVRIERRVADSGGDPLLALDVLRSNGLGSGISTLFCMALTYGGVLFIVTLHLQDGLGYSALRTGLTYIALSGTTGLAAYYWRRIPARLQHLIPPSAMTLCVLGYLGLALAVRGGGAGTLLYVALAFAGVGQGLTMSPVMALSLVDVPLKRAGDASGLLTTTLQLGSVTGVAVFGSVFLSLARHSGPHPSASALAVTLTAGLATTAVVGTFAAASLSRAVVQARRRAAIAAQPAAQPNNA